MPYGDFKHLARRTALNKVLRDKKHLVLLKTQNMMDIKEVLLLWFINFSIKKPLLVVLKMKLNKTNNLLKNQRQYLGC